MAPEDQKKDLPHTVEKTGGGQAAGTVQPEGSVVFEFDNRPRFSVCEHD